MKYKMIAFFLVLTLMSWAQTATQNNPTPAPEQKGDQAKASCPCCDATAQTKDQHAGCMRNASSKDGGGKMACCSDKGTTCCGKDGKSCKRSDKATTACCSECNERDKACCAMGEHTKTTAMNCCGTQWPCTPAITAS